jgi:curli biogenesis system outer membrane secretion channel CsgG
MNAGPYPIHASPRDRLALGAWGPVAALLLLSSACIAMPSDEAPQVDSARTTAALKAQMRPHGDLPTVTIYEFRSEVDELSPRGATDMFKSALVNGGQFRVLERARVNEGVIREKQMNAAGLTRGRSARTAMTEAQYIFEGAITEINPGEKQSDSAFGVAGAQVGHSSNRDVVGVDVRAVDSSTGEIVAVVSVKKAIASQSNSVSGLGSLLSTVLASKGKNTDYVPEVQVQGRRAQSLDSALRAAIDQAVLELGKRVPH